MPPTLQAGGTTTTQEHFPLSLSKLLEHFAHPIVTIVHLQYQTTGHRVVTSEEGPELG
jgi:hypothetical protein